jgi:transposase InsO family protein
MRKVSGGISPIGVGCRLMKELCTPNRTQGIRRQYLTYIPTSEGWLYLAVVLDLFSRKVVGWAMRNTMAQELTLAALRMAVINRKPGPGLLHHADRGSQYAAHDYRRLLARHGMLCSMSRKGDCWNNAPMESFFGSLKTEITEERPFETRQAARSAPFGFIEGFYNGAASTRPSATKPQPTWNNPPRPRRP